MGIPRKIGPFIQGMNTLADEVSLPADQCRSAKDLDIDKAGNYECRQGFVRLVATTNVHSLFPAVNKSHVFGCQNNNLGYFDIVVPNFNSLITMPSAFLTSWTKFNGIIYASNPAFNQKINPLSYAVSSLGVTLPPALTIAAITSGGIRAGTYTVTYSVTDILGEESPTAPETQITVVENGGIAISGVPIDANSNLRIYVSQPDGEEFYRAIDAPRIASSYSLGINELSNTGAQPETRFLEPLPFGHFISNNGSRLFVASENMLAFSSPFRPHLWDSRFNFVLFESTITMLAPTTNGYYVSDGESVKFLQGNDPEQWVLDSIDADPAIYNSASVIPGSHISQDLNQSDSVVIWLSRTGHIAGLPNGSILRLNPGQLDLPAYSVASSAMTRRNGIKRVVIPVNSNQRNGTGTALDSEIF